MEGIGVSGDGDSAASAWVSSNTSCAATCICSTLLRITACTGSPRGSSPPPPKRLQLKKQGENRICGGYLHGSAGIQCNLRRPHIRGKSQTGEGIAQGGTGSQRHRRDRYHQPLRDLQQSGKCLSLLRLGKDHEEPLHEISYIAPRSEIISNAKWRKAKSAKSPCMTAQPSF